MAGTAPWGHPAAWARSDLRLGNRSSSVSMSRNQVTLLITAGICILALVSWVGEIDLGLDQFLDQPGSTGTPAQAPAPASPAPSNQPRPSQP